MRERRRNQSIISLIAARAAESRGSVDARRDEDQSGPKTPEVGVDVSDLNRRVELYEYQLRTLRGELEQIKMQTILEGLRGGGVPECVIVKPEPAFDEALFSNIYDLHDPDSHGGHAALGQWARAARNSEPARCKAVGFHRPFSESAQSPGSTIRMLSARLYDALARNSVQEFIIRHASRAADTALNKGNAPIVSEDDVSADLQDVALLHATGRRACHFELADAATIIMDMETHVEALQEVIQFNSQSQEENRRLRRENYELNERLKGFAVDFETHFNQRLALFRKLMMKEYDWKLESEREMRADVEAQLEANEADMKKLRDDIASALKENENLTNENAYYRVLTGELKTRSDPERPTRRAAPRPDAPEIEVEEIEHILEIDPVPLDVLEKEFAAIIEDAGERVGLEILLRLRGTVLQSRRYDDGTKMLLEMLERPDGKYLLPAISLLVGELYNVSGRPEEARGYLSNPMINSDPLAVSLRRCVPAYD